MAHQTLVEMFHDRVNQSKTQIALRQRQGEKWVDINWVEWKERSQRIAAGLAALGIEPGDRVALISNSRADWAIADIGILLCGAVTVPIYQSSLPEEVSFILNDCEAKVVICEDPSQLDKIYTYKESLKSLSRAVYIDRSVELEKPDAKGRTRVELANVLATEGDDFSLSWEALLAAGEEELAKTPHLLEDKAKTLTPEKLATLVYTSGTTGKPKGVMLTHRNFLFEIEAVQNVANLRTEDKQFLFLPLAHIFAKCLMLTSIRQGICTAIDSSITRIIPNCQEIKPTFMGAVPRVYEKAYVKIKSNAEKETGLKQKIFFWATSVGKKVSLLRQRGEEPTGLLAFQYKLADKLVFSKIKERFGGNIRFFISGGAPLSREIAEFLHAADLLVLEGYGLTETAAATHINRPDAYKFGTVGKALPGVNVKIAEEDGEILINAPNVLQGYYNRPDATNEALEKIDDVIWFHTGDVGEIDTEGFLKITDRKKALFKTSGGKYIAPQLIENSLKAKSKYVSQVMVYGEHRNFVSALITLNEENILDWAKENGESADLDALAKSEKVRQLIQSDLEAVNQTLPSYETVKKFAIVSPDFAIETGELTPTLKVKRKVVVEKHKEVLEGFYDEMGAKSAL